MAFEGWLFYSGNPGRRTELATLCAKLNELIDKCCKATNRLIGYIERYLPGPKFQTISVDPSKSIRDNCDLILDRVHEIDLYLDEKTVQLKEYVGTELFTELVSIDTSFQKSIDIAKRVMLIPRTAFTLGAIIVPVLVRKQMLLSKLTAGLNLVKVSRCACLGLGVLCLATEVIASIIIGAIEKENLEKAIKEYTEAVEKLEPFAEEFYDNMCMLRARIEQVSTSR